MDPVSITMLGVFDHFLFQGVTSNLAWDIIKHGHKAITSRKWEELYIDAFQVAVTEFGAQIRKYTDQNNATVELRRQSLERILHQNLSVAIGIQSLSELTDDRFLEVLTDVLTENEVLEIGGHNLDRESYRGIINKVVMLAASKFESEVSSNQGAFQIAMIRQAKGDYKTLLGIMEFCENRFELTLNLLRDLLETQISLATGQQEIKDILHLFVSYDRLDQRISDLINHGLSDTSVLFFQGYASWAAILQDYDVRRRLSDRDGNRVFNFAEVITELENAYTLSESGQQILVKFFGEAGSGKTTLSMRIAYELYLAGYPVLYKKESANNFAENEIRRFQKEHNRPVFVFLEDVSIQDDVRNLYRLSRSLVP